MLGVRVQPPEMARLDEWISRQPDPKPSRPEAMRRLVEKGLASDGVSSATVGAILSDELNASNDE
jgi:hypothetical protein